MEMDPPLIAPLGTTINITESCQLNCVYCYARTRTAGPVHMPADMAVDLVKELHHLGVWKIVIGGGEPFLHPQWQTIFRQILESGIGIAVISNGVAVRDNLGAIENLFTTFPDKISLQISVDGPTPEVHDRSRGRGREVFRALELLCEAAIPVQLATVVTRFNIDTARMIPDVFYPRIKRYHFMNLMPSHKSFDKRDRLDAGRRACDRLWETLGKTAEAHPDMFLSIPGCDAPPGGDIPTMNCPGCTAGFSKMDVNANGDILACQMAYKSVMGNLHRNRFKDIWFSEEADTYRRFERPLCFEAAFQ